MTAAPTPPPSADAAPVDALRDDAERLLALAEAAIVRREIWRIAEFDRSSPKAIYVRAADPLLVAKLCRAALADPAPQTDEPSSSLVFQHEEAKALVEFFGGDEGMVTVGLYRKARESRDDGEPMPPGLWAHMTEYPEEGSVYLGPGDL